MVNPKYDRAAYVNWECGTLNGSTMQLMLATDGSDSSGMANNNKGNQMTTILQISMLAQLVSFL